MGIRFKLIIVIPAATGMEKFVGLLAKEVDTFRTFELLPVTENIACVLLYIVIFFHSKLIL